MWGFLGKLVHSENNNSHESGSSIDLHGLPARKWKSAFMKQIRTCIIYEELDYQNASLMVDRLAAVELSG